MDFSSGRLIAPYSIQHCHSDPAQPYSTPYLVFSMLRTIASRCCPSCCPARLSTRSRSPHRSIHSTSTRYNKVPSFDGERPSPPRLPPHLQKEFEELQRRAATPLASTESSSASASSNSSSSSSAINEEHPDIRKKPKPEFEGDINPKTGEVGGPKNNPLSYEKEWTYGGRATDF